TGVLTFIDSHPTTDDSADFSERYRAATGQPDAWNCLPGQQHNRGANLAFADGHVEHWRWRWDRSGGPYAVGNGGSLNLVENADDQYDFQRVEDHSPKPR